MTNVKINDYCLMRCRNNLSDLGYSWCSEELLTEYHDKKIYHQCSSDMSPGL